MNAWAEMDLLRAKTLEEMRELSGAAVPGGECSGVPPGERTWNIDGTQVEYLDAVRYTQWFNTLAAPAAVVPVGRSPEGMPIGVQIAGRPFEDEVVLGVAGIVDRAFGYQAPAIRTLISGASVARVPRR